tara:strand:+ start:844 stop:1026 length:183 start_codon:yes stop_codon:yes gene_type:complete
MDIFWIIVFLILLVLPLSWEPSRKAIGLLNIVLGTIISLTGVGILIGIPMIIFGGICLFY